MHQVIICLIELFIMSQPPVMLLVLLLVGACVLCLGILPQVADPSIAQQMAHELRATGYQFTDYSIAAITLPLTCTLRQIGMHMHLQQWWQAEVHGPSVADTAASSIPSASEPVTSASSPSIGVVARPISLKDAIRWTLGGSFRNAVNVPCERDVRARVHGCVVTDVKSQT